MNPRIQRKRAGSGTASVHATRSASISPRWIATRGRSQPSRFPDAPNLLSEKCSTESDISRIVAKRGRPPMAFPMAPSTTPAMAPAPSIGWVSPASSRTTATRRLAFVSVNLIGLDPSAGTPERQRSSGLRVGTPTLKALVAPSRLRDAVGIDWARKTWLACTALPSRSGLGLEPMVRAARMIGTHLPHILVRQTSGT